MAHILDDHTTYWPRDHSAKGSAHKRGHKLALLVRRRPLGHQAVATRIHHAVEEADQESHSEHRIFVPGSCRRSQSRKDSGHQTTVAGNISGSQHFGQGSSGQRGYHIAVEIGPQQQGLIRLRPVITRSILIEIIVKNRYYNILLKYNKQIVVLRPKRFWFCSKHI